MITIEQIKQMVNKGRLALHHSSVRKGYYSRKMKPSVYEYEGKFGKGYTVEQNNPKSTWFGVKVSYYIMCGD